MIHCNFDFVSAISVIRIISALFTQWSLWCAFLKGDNLKERLAKLTLSIKESTSNWCQIMNVMMMKWINCIVVDLIQWMYCQWIDVIFAVKFQSIRVHGNVF